MTGGPSIDLSGWGVVALTIGRHGWAGLGGCALPRSEAECEFVEGDANPIVQGEVGGDRVVAAPEVLHECVPSCDRARRGQSAESAHWPQPCLEPTVIGFDAVVRVLLGDVPRGRLQLVEYARVDRRSIGGDLSRDAPDAQRADEERACSRGIPAGRDEHADNLTVLIDRAVQVDSAAADPDVRLVHEPPVPDGVPGRTRCVDELRSEGLYPAIDRDVINLDAALAEQLFDIAVGQAVAQVPAHRDRDHLTGKWASAGLGVRRLVRG
jgi:hypothetical protein